MLIEEITEFLANYFFSGYTIFNTLVYGIILVMFIFVIIKLFEYYNINPADLILPLIPFVFLGSVARALVDNGIYSYNWFLITPGIYFIVGGLAITTLLFSIYLERWRSIDFRYTIFIIGMIIAIYNLINIHNFNLIAMAQVLIIWGFFTIIFALFTKILVLFNINFPLFNISYYNGKVNFSIIAAHLLDASTTFMAVDYYGYFEQHVLPDYIYNLSGTAITMFPLKIIVISISLYLIDNYIDDETIAGTLKLTIFILGLAPGIRNLLTLAMGTAF